MIWTPEEQARAPVGDFPPLWAAAWGDDEFGLWADLRWERVAQRMRWIEPGTFWMGSTEERIAAIKDKEVRRWAAGQERPRHLVTLTRGYWLADTPCTQGMWEAVMGGNRSEFKGESGSAQRPVENVSWDDVQEFLEKLNARLPAGVGAGLPTEAQWEYAARAGSETTYQWGDEEDGRRANWGNQRKGTTAVKRYEPNGWGLYDMHGNVWAWCEGGRREYSDRPVVDPADVAGGDVRALRGGSWLDHPGCARSAYRYGFLRVDRWNNNGFRLVLRSESPGGGAAGLGPRSGPGS